MAKTCCICQEKIGVLDKGGELIEGRDDTQICMKCAEKIGYAKVELKESSSRATIKYKRDAIEFFSACITGGKVSRSVRSYLKSLTGITEEDINKAASEAQAQAERERRYMEERNKVIVSTSLSIPGYEIVRHCGVVMGESTVGTGIVADNLAAMSDLTGSTSHTMENTVRAVKQNAVQSIVKEAIFKDGNAVIGLEMDVFALRDNMVCASATGTAVVVRETS